MWSGRQDSNLRPPAPKAGALAKLSYAPVLQTVLHGRQLRKAGIRRGEMTEYHSTMYKIVRVPTDKPVESTGM